jgi:hypothetical protein
MMLHRRPVDARAWWVSLVGLAIALTFTLRILLLSHMDPSVFLALGEQAPVQTEYARDLLDDVQPRHFLGHDGKYFFAQANDPWYLNPQAHASVLDRPIYRAQRMLFPMLAGGFGLFEPQVVVWAMLAVNIAAMWLGALVAAKLAITLKASPWLGLAVPLNIGLILEVFIGGAGVLAFVLALAAVYALTNEHDWTGALFMTGAVLSREVMLLFAVGVFILSWRAERRIRWQLLILPVTALGLWNLYLFDRLRGVSGAGGQPQPFAAPFAGMWEASQAWLQQPGDMLLIGAMLVVVVVFTIRAVRSRLPLAWGALPFVALSTVLSVHVWLEPFDLSRALAPIFTAAAFVVFAQEPRPSEVPVSTRPSTIRSKDAESRASG